jgi:NAD(P)-dependent dehydrogenase (short-subunit alcohol dehydrogenase family)
MRIVVIGGSGHIGTFLIPRLVRAGHDVVNISRGQRSSYIDDPAWQHVRHVTADRAVEDREGTFPARVAGLDPDVVIDLICFTLDSATALVQRLRGQTGHGFGSAGGRMSAQSRRSMLRRTRRPGRGNSIRSCRNHAAWSADGRGSVTSATPLAPRHPRDSRQKRTSSGWRPGDSRRARPRGPAWAPRQNRAPQRSAGTVTGRCCPWPAAGGGP